MNISNVNIIIYLLLGIFLAPVAIYLVGYFVGYGMMRAKKNFLKELFKRKGD